MFVRANKLTGIHGQIECRACSNITAGRGRQRVVGGLRTGEIAERTGLTPESVRVNLCRGMKMLRERL